MHQVGRARAVRKIGERIIDFLAQIENFQKRLFEKKKFVVETGYCVTLDQVPESCMTRSLHASRSLTSGTELYAITSGKTGSLIRGTRTPHLRGNFWRATRM